MNTHQPPVAIVTGAARGIGAEVAMTLASAGYRVAAVDIRESDTTVASIVASGGIAQSWPCDIRSWDKVHDVVQSIESTWGAVDALAAVAGVWRPVRFANLTLADWKSVVDVNLQGTFTMCHAATDAMRRSGRGGAVVVISSNAAVLGFEGGVHYSASKAGLLGLVTGMAFELGVDKIRVNAISPGTIATQASEIELVDADIHARQVGATTLGRLGRPSDIASAVQFLLDPNAASWITGITLTVDGGYGSHGEGASDFLITDTTVERQSGMPTTGSQVSS